MVIVVAGWLKSWEEIALFMDALILKRRVSHFSSFLQITKEGMDQTSAEDKRQVEGSKRVLSSLL